MMQDEEVPEVSEAEELLSSYARIKALLNGFENESREWSNALYDELNDPIKSNLLNKINVYDRDAEFFELLRSVDPVRDRSNEFEIRPELLDHFKLDNEFDALMNSVEMAKVKSICRAERLQDSFRKLKICQQEVVDRIVLKLKSEAGLTKIETKAKENYELIDRLKEDLLEKNETIATNNREKELTADELRLKYESQIEEKIRGMMQTIEAKTKELGVVTSTQGRLKSEYSNLQNSLGMLLRDLDSEEKASAVDAQIAINPVARFRASVYRNAASRGTSTNLFGDMSSGTITKELVTDSQRALNEAFEKQKELYQAINASEERTHNLRKELTQVIQSEENKALDRLKKVCDNLQVKIQSDEQRVKVMATLVNQIQKGDDSAHRSASQKIRSADGTTLILDKPSAGASHKHSRRGLKKSKSKDKADAAAPGGVVPAEDSLPFPELMHLLPDPQDRQRESISMKMHRRLYAQYFVKPAVDTVKENSSDSDTTSRSEKKVAVTASSKKHSKKELPRKRRITSSQSSKIQKIMDMVSAQLAKLSAVKDEDIKHIFDYRAFPDDAERMHTSQSSGSGVSAVSAVSGISGGTGGSRSQKRQLQEQLLQEQRETTDDHSKIFHGGSTSRQGTLTPRPPGSSRPSSRGPDQMSIRSSMSDDHLRIPVTADLEDMNDAEFYAQNYGIKLALENLTAFLEVLTSGQSSDTAFLRRNTGNGKHKMQFSGDEQEELQTVDGLRGNINTLIGLIRELHALSQSNKLLCRDLHKEVDSKLKECDRLRSELLHDVEGAHWPQATRAGQYELGIEQSKEKLRDLKVEVKQWEQRVSIKRAQNIRLSQVVANTSTRRASAVHKLDPHSEEILKPRKKYAPPVAGHPPPLQPKSPKKTELTSEEAPMEPSLSVDATRTPSMYNFSVANKRMDLFDDMSHIYDSAIRSIKLSAAPVEPPSVTSAAEEVTTNLENDGTVADTSQNSLGV